MSIQSTRFFSFFLFFSAFLWFQSIDSVSGQGLNPTSTSIPPVVFCQVNFNKVSKVDGVEQLFNADFYMQSMWFDMALQDVFANAFVNNSGMMPPIASGNFEFTPYLNGWYDPRIEFTNAQGPVDESGVYYTITTPSIISDEYLKALNVTTPRDQLYWLVKDYRYIGDFNTPLDLLTFPFDRQYVQVAMESITFDRDHLVFFYTNPNAIEAIRLDEDKHPIVGWKVRNARALRTEQEYKALSIAGTYSRLVVSLEVEREPSYYVMKLCMGVILLVLMCIWVFALAVDEADRMMGTLTVFGGIVTFLFVSTQYVPPVPYQTRLDNFFTFSFLMVAFMLFLHGLLYFCREEEEGDKKEGGNGGEEESKNGTGGTNKIAPLETAAAFNGFPSPPLSHRLRRWYKQLVPTRKVDAIAIPVLSIIYLIGVCALLGQPFGAVRDIYENAAMGPTPMDYLREHSG